MALPTPREQALKILNMPVSYRTADGSGSIPFERYLFDKAELARRIGDEVAGTSSVPKAVREALFGGCTPPPSPKFAAGIDNAAARWERIHGILKTIAAGNSPTPEECRALDRFSRGTLDIAIAGNEVDEESPGPNFEPKTTQDLEAIQREFEILSRLPAIASIKRGRTP